MICVNSIVQSFEAITTNLVGQENFTNLTVIERDVTMEAIRVSIIHFFVYYLVYSMIIRLK